jgi:hypothetical protein
MLVLLAGMTCFGVMGTFGVVRAARRIEAGAGDRTLMCVVGIESTTGVWVLERVDDGSRIKVWLLGGGKRLVAGDTLIADGTLRPPTRTWRIFAVHVLALTSESGGTLWASHRENVKKVRSTSNS